MPVIVMFHEADSFAWCCLSENHCRLFLCFAGLDCGGDLGDVVTVDPDYMHAKSLEFLGNGIEFGLNVFRGPVDLDMIAIDNNG